MNGQRWKRRRDIGSGADSPLVVPSSASGNTIYAADARGKARAKKCPLVTPTARGFPVAGRPSADGVQLYKLGEKFKSRACPAGWDDGAARTHTADSGRCLPRIWETCGRCGEAPSRTDAYILTGQSDKLSSGLPTGMGAVSRLRKKRPGINFLPHYRGTAGRGKATGQSKRPAVPE